VLVVIIVPKRSQHSTNWQKLERGEIDVRTFLKHFGDEISSQRSLDTYSAYLEKVYPLKQGLASRWKEDRKRIAHLKLDSLSVLCRIMSPTSAIQQDILDTISEIRRSRPEMKIVILTNNFEITNKDREELGLDFALPLELLSSFDAVYESWKLKMRK
jgi:hypothetical protein